MSEISSTEWLEPAGRVAQTERRDPQSDGGSQGRRRPRPPVPQEADAVESPDAPHQVDQRI